MRSAFLQIFPSIQKLSSSFFEDEALWLVPIQN
jgi:hypothetical protein